MEEENNQQTEEQEHSYIKINIEGKLSKSKRDDCSQIVREIKNFGVNQRQILYLIQLLSLELENTDVMKALTATVGQYRELIPVEEEQTSNDQIASMPTTT